VDGPGPVRWRLVRLRSTGVMIRRVPLAKTSGDGVSGAVEAAATSGGG